MLHSLDTNILLYGINADCPEHGTCRNILDQALARPHDWIVADQVWFELYRLLRNPMVLEHPMGAGLARDTIKWFRTHSGWLHCAWEHSLMPSLEEKWGEADFPARNSFDMILALTLKFHGVSRFYTRNTKDFAELGWFDLINPLA